MLRLWPWFVAGFLLVFIGILVFGTTYFYDGHELYRTKVWHYYMLELNLARKSRNLGPTSGNAGAALTFAGQHILCAIVGGVVLTGIGWGLGKMRRKKD